MFLHLDYTLVLHAILPGISRTAHARVTALHLAHTHLCTFLFYLPCALLHHSHCTGTHAWDTAPPAAPPLHCAPHVPHCTLTSPGTHTAWGGLRHHLSPQEFPFTAHCTLRFSPGSAHWIPLMHAPLLTCTTGTHYHYLTAFFLLFPLPTSPGLDHARLDTLRFLRLTAAHALICGLPLFLFTHWDSQLFSRTPHSVLHSRFYTGSGIPRVTCAFHLHSLTVTSHLTAPGSLPYTTFPPHTRGWFGSRSVLDRFCPAISRSTAVDCTTRTRIPFTAFLHVHCSHLHLHTRTFTSAHLTLGYTLHARHCRLSPHLRDCYRLCGYTRCHTGPLRLPHARMIYLHRWISGTSTTAPFPSLHLSFTLHVPNLPLRFTVLHHGWVPLLLHTPHRTAHLCCASALPLPPHLLGSRSLRFTCAGSWVRLQFTTAPLPPVSHRTPLGIDLPLGSATSKFRFYLLDLYVHRACVRLPHGILHWVSRTLHWTTAPRYLRTVTLDSVPRHCTHLWVCAVITIYFYRTALHTCVFTFMLHYRITTRLLHLSLHLTAYPAAAVLLLHCSCLTLHIHRAVPLSAVALTSLLSLTGSPCLCLPCVFFFFFFSATGPPAPALATSGFALTTAHSHLCAHTHAATAFRFCTSARSAWMHCGCAHRLWVPPHHSSLPRTALHWTSPIHLGSRTSFAYWDPRTTCRCHCSLQSLLHTPDTHLQMIRARFTSLHLFPTFCSGSHRRCLSTGWTVDWASPYLLRGGSPVRAPARSCSVTAMIPLSSPRFTVHTGSVTLIFRFSWDCTTCTGHHTPHHASPRLLLHCTLRTARLPSRDRLHLRSLHHCILIFLHYHRILHVYHQFDHTPLPACATLHALSRAAPQMPHAPDFYTHAPFPGYWTTVHSPACTSGCLPAGPAQFTSRFTTLFRILKPRSSFSSALGSPLRWDHTLLHPLPALAAHTSAPLRVGGSALWFTHTCTATTHHSRFHTLHARTTLQFCHGTLIPTSYTLHSRTFTG